MGAITYYCRRGMNWGWSRFLSSRNSGCKSIDEESRDIILYYIGYCPYLAMLQTVLTACKEPFSTQHFVLKKQKQSFKNYLISDYLNTSLASFIFHLNVFIHFTLAKCIQLLHFSIVCSFILTKNVSFVHLIGWQIGCIWDKQILNNLIKGNNVDK